MAEIAVLDSKTIDQIAAGEVVERPASVAKELVENACDAGATAITVEIKDGGIRFLRVTDNGSGIEKQQVQKAFFRHATSKIHGAEDLEHIESLGFRGEALSSIAAVSMVEMITKTRDALTGVRYCIEGERERDFSEVGAPEGTTIIIRELFFNTPARRKFLKSPATEGGYVADLMEHMALSRPDISFQFIVNRQTKFATSGSGDLKEVIYRIYGREIAKEVFAFDAAENGIRIHGFLGTPLLVRPNRNFEFFFVNNRYIKSQILSKGLESGYQSWLMQHKFPMAYLHLELDTKEVDVNVHPSKMEVRFSDNRRLFDFLEQQVKRALHEREMIPAVTLDKPENPGKEAASHLPPAAFTTSTPADSAPPASAPADAPTASASADSAPQPARNLAQKLLRNPPPQTKRPLFEKRQETAQKDRPQPPGTTLPPQEKAAFSQEKTLPPQPFEAKRREALVKEERLAYAAAAPAVAKEQQMNLFEDRILSEKAVRQYELIGQIFDTYWIASYQDKMILIDQHAAHEKVKYEALLQKVRRHAADSQNLMPPAIVTLSGTEAKVLEQYQEYFEQLGFEIEPFGGNSYALRAVPCDLYGSCGADFLQDTLNDLASEQHPGTPAAITERIATMACKAAVKGNMKISRAEMQELLGQLLELDNPYHCPHGRPTMITMSRQELERKFKRIV